MLKALRSIGSRIRATFRGWINTALLGTHHHYFFHLPRELGSTATLMLKLFYSGIRLDPHQRSIFKKIPADAVLVLANQNKSYFEYLFYHTRYRYGNLPVPEIGLDYRVFLWQPLRRILRILLSRIDYFFQHLQAPDPYKSGHVRQELLRGKTAMLPLLEKKGFYRRFVKSQVDPLRHLIEIQSETDRPIYIIPHLMFFGKKPGRSVPSLIDILFGPEENPGILRRLVVLFRSPGRVFTEISEPVNLKAFLERPENTQRSIESCSNALRLHLLSRINRHRQSITGPVLKSREEIKQAILTSERLQAFMNHYAETRNIPIQKVHKEADADLDEIAANYNLAIIKLGAMVVRWAIKNMFDGVMVNDEMLARLKAMSLRGPLILVPCHKSHIDYLILSYVLYQNNLPCPLVAAGKNLSFWPIGPLFRGGGAFFIRRSFRGAVLYSKVFTEYIEKLLEEGFNIEFFIEGGRSRTGKLIMPKLGLLSILLNGMKSGACEDLIFAPIYIGYDQVLEDSAYLDEIEGGQKKPESFWQVLKARKFLKKRYGKIYLQFQEPIALNDLLNGQETALARMTTREQNTLVRNLGLRIISAINRVSVVTPHALVASAILNSYKDSFSYGLLLSQLETYLTYLYAQGTQLADTLVIDHEHAVRNVLDAYGQRKVIEKLSKSASPTDTIYGINESKRPILEYYKNNCIAHFIPAAFSALSILEQDAFQFSASDLYATFTFLEEFFKNEFVSDVDKPPEFVLRKNLKAFIDDAVLIPHPTLPDTYNLTSAGFRKLKLFASFLITYFESYWVVLSCLRHNSKNGLNAADRLKQIQSRGQRMYKRKEIERQESLSKINYANAVDFFISNGVKGSEDKDQLEFYAGKIQSFLRHLAS